jgi:hypothetical protein
MLVKGKVVEQAALAAKALEATKENKAFLPLNLQYFAEGGDGGQGDEPGTGDDPGTGDEPGGDNPGDNDDPPADDKTKGKSFTQDDVNAIAAKEAKKAQEKLLRQLGVKDAKSAKDALEQFQKMQDDQKTDAQKTAERAKQLEEDYNSLSSENKTLKAHLAGLKAGVKADSLDDVIVLADKLVNDDTTIDDAIAQVLKKYPQFAAEKQADPDTKKQTKKPKFSDSDHKKDDKPTDEDKWTTAFKWGN